MTSGHLALRSLGCAVLAVLAAVAIGACGSSSSTSSTSGSETSGGSEAESSGVSAQASQAYERFSQPIKEWPGPEEPVSPAKGKQLTVITCGSQGITCVRVANGVKAAGEVLGYEIKEIDGQGNPSVWNQAIKAAVADKTDGIVLAGVPPSLVVSALQDAKAANIPVAAALSILGSGPEVKVDYPRTHVVEANSAFIATDSNASAKVLELRDPEFPETNPYTKLYPQELKQACSGGCEVVDSIKFSLALAAQRLPSDLTQALQSNPEINYITMPFDTIAPFVSQGIRQAGMTGKVKMVGIGADPPSIQAIESGDEVESLGSPAEWMGWDAVDGLVRILVGDKVPPLQTTNDTETNYNVPLKYITAENLPGPEGWQGDFDYQKKFRELWGE
jgi:ribose transport system substrate-binding protein